MKIFAPLVILSGVCINAPAQFSSPEYNELTFGLSISTTYHSVAVTDLNTVLNSNALKKINTSYLNLGAGLNFKVNRHFIQLAGDFDINENTTFNNDSVGTSSYGYSVNINYGYSFNLFDQCILVPYSGISRTIFKTKITDNTQRNFDFQWATTTRNAISVDNNTFSIALGSRFLFPIGDYEFSYCGLDICYGVKTNSEWTTNGAKIPNAPAINPSGLKVGIIIMCMIGK